MAQTTHKPSVGPILSSSGCGDTESDVFLGTAVLTRILRANLHKSVQSPNHVTLLNFSFSHSETQTSFDFLPPPPYIPPPTPIY
jgi:hypothetical protein